MSTLHEAARAALEALDDVIERLEFVAQPREPYPAPSQIARQKADALRAALAASEAQGVAPFGWVSKHTTPGLYEWQFNKDLAACYRDTALFIIPVYEHPPASAPRVPQGWKLVPVEPTQEMCQQGQWKAQEWPKFPLRISPIYKAMLAAAPQPEGGE